MVVARHPLLQLARVSGRDGQGPDGKHLGALHNVSVTLEAGVHAFVGRPEDGTAALCELVAGRRAPVVGQVTILGREPSRSAATRRHIGAVLPRPDLPGRTVRAAIKAMGELRGLRLDNCLDELGVSDLADREVASLSPAEARAVQLASLLSTPGLHALAVYEPGSVVAIDEHRVRQGLAEQASTGTCVVVATASPDQLGSLPDHVYLLEAGKLWGCDDEVGWARVSADRELPEHGPSLMQTMSLLLTERHARQLSAALSERAAVESVHWGMHSHSGLSEMRVSGADLRALALTVADAVTSTQVDVTAMHSASASIEGMRAAARAHRTAIEERERLAVPTPMEGAP